MTSSAEEARTLARIEQFLAGDDVLESVAGLFAEPTAPRSTNRTATSSSRQVRRRTSRPGLAVLLAAPVVTAAVIYAVAAAILPPLLGAVAILVAAGAGTGSLVRAAHPGWSPTSTGFRPLRRRPPAGR